MEATSFCVFFIIIQENVRKSNCFGLKME
ncbi:MAG: hypothetical protein H6Q59_3449, partial [Firmicutes bacterium]|nr:hypothetical protein [Bacillota bacterium]